MNSESSKRVLCEGLRFSPVPAAFEEPIFEKKVKGKNTFWRKGFVIGSLYHKLKGFSVEPPGWILDKTFGI